MADSQVLEANWELTDSFPSALFKKKCSEKPYGTSEAKRSLYAQPETMKMTKKKVLVRTFGICIQTSLFCVSNSALMSR